MFSERLLYRGCPLFLRLKICLGLQSRLLRVQRYFYLLFVFRFFAIRFFFELFLVFDEAGVDEVLADFSAEVADSDLVEPHYDHQAYVGRLITHSPLHYQSQWEVDHNPTTIHTRHHSQQTHTTDQAANHSQDWTQHRNRRVNKHKRHTDCLKVTDRVQYVP